MLSYCSGATSAMRIHNVSLVAKLNVLLAIAAGVALLVSCVAFVAHDVRKTRSAKIEHLAAIADTVAAANLESLAARDAARAQRALAALRTHAQIAFGALYDAHGNLLASYQHPAHPAVAPPAAQAADGFHTDDGYFGVFRHVADQNGPVGAVYLRAAMWHPGQELLHYVRIVSLVSVAALSLSVIVSSRLQGLVTAPIVRLTAAAQRISAQRDYSLRVQKAAGDELGTLYDEFNAMLERVAQGERELQAAHDQLESRVQQRTSQLLQTNLKLSREVAERQRAEQELAILHQKLVDAAHRAGMAEIATDVLHNVGNVLNSVNVSCAVAAEQLRDSSAPEVERVARLLDEHRDQLGDFISSDERGQQVPHFLHLLGQQLLVEQAALVREINVLGKNVDHIKDIVAMQQSYAGVSGVVEPVRLADLLEDAVRLNASGLEKHSIEIVRQYAPLPQMLAQKQKLLQVLVNLVQNARDALSESGRLDARLVLSIQRTADEAVRIEVRDNGAGIPAENMTRIFAHGFTTKQMGHGFGLHSCANAAKEMGGRLTATSDGVGCGASFKLDLPLKPIEVLV